LSVRTSSRRRSSRQASACSAGAARSARAAAADKRSPVLKRLPPDTLRATADTSDCSAAITSSSVSPGWTLVQ
jgi:hypothetical protein